MPSFSTPGPSEPVLVAEPDPDGRGWCVRAFGLEKRHIGPSAANAPPILRVKVGEAFDDGALPDVAGNLQRLAGEVRFVPDFPFRAGILYRAVLDLRGREECGAVTLDFLVPEKKRGDDVRVTHIYPSSDVLPENLLRFTVRFSGPMSRSCAGKHVRLVGADGSPVPDALYRAPVELWDRSMTCLTILLDPGRLKRGVGPNRMLGSPLKAGRRYTLNIEPGMIDAQGRRLAVQFSKSFTVGKSVRAAVAPETWNVCRPAAGSREPLELTFPSPLDWAQLWHGIIVARQSGDPVEGAVDISQEEKCWRFTPRDPWRKRAYQIRVSPTLEDCCGNTPSGPFDGPLRCAEDVLRETAIRSLGFAV